MDDYEGRVLADRYRLPRPPADEFEPAETRALDTYSGQEVLVRQVPLPEVVSADPHDPPPYGGTRELSDSARRALDAARAAAALPDHPRLVQVFDIFTDAGSLWVVSELVAARPLAALLAEKRMSPYRAAEIASDVLTALRAVHAAGWTHRNVTAATVLVCDDGRAMLGGLAVGAAQEALCGYDPVPARISAMAGGGDGGPESAEDAHGWGGPDSPLAWERARQARITVVGAVTERWAPEQAAGTPHDRQPAPPDGPAADLWALGSLLYRGLQGHPPFPEENAAELVQLVRDGAPALAGERGPLRFVVESLLRQDPGERPGPGELNGWLRSLVRSAPEPELGLGTVPLPSENPHRLPVVRRRGELVRRRRMSAETVPVHHGRQRARDKRRGRSPRGLGFVLLGLVLLLLAAVVVYAVLFMPRTTRSTGGAAGAVRTVPAVVDGGGTGGFDGRAQTASSAPETPAATPRRPRTTSGVTPTGLDRDFRLAADPAGFSLAVPAGWQRHGRNAKGRIQYTGGDFRLTIVPGRDSVAGFGSDPLAYQSGEEPELDAFHASDWSSAFGARSFQLNGDSAAEGEYTWRDSGGRPVYARNLAVVIDGTYHVILVTGPQAAGEDVKRYFEKAERTYRTP